MGYGMGYGYGGYGLGGYGGYGWGGYGGYGLFGKRSIPEVPNRMECIYMSGANQLNCNK